MHCTLHNAGVHLLYRTFNYNIESGIISMSCLCAVDFVLRDPRESSKEPEPVVLPAHREEIAVLPKPWHRSFVQAVNTARDTLHVTSPCMQQVLQLWFASFRFISCFILRALT